jgi:hypothetical protein
MRTRSKRYRKALGSVDAEGFTGFSHPAIHRRYMSVGKLVKSVVKSDPLKTL